MKAPLTKHYCIVKKCDWEVTNHKDMDGLKCPKCNGFINSKRINKIKN
ncbi:hypothetical protein P5663_06895 [Priestia flexa]|nr:hypothetical protein [Priestia flexa]WEZ09566.1 hypothetical protein P5663_06895 [Priestia flexa]